MGVWVRRVINRKLRNSVPGSKLAQNIVFFVKKNRNLQAQTNFLANVTIESSSSQPLQSHLGCTQGHLKQPLSDVIVSG